MSSVALTTGQRRQQRREWDARYTGSNARIGIKEQNRYQRAIRFHTANGNQMAEVRMGFL